MESIFQYSLAVSIPLLILWVSYHLSFSKVRLLGSNRIVIIAVYAVSLVMMPLMSYFSFFPLDFPADADSTFNATQVVNSNSWMRSLSFVWLAGALICVSSTLLELLWIQKIKVRCTKAEYYGNTIHISDDPELNPFSFGDMIVMSRKDFNENAETIIRHETGHRSYCHSIDLFLSQIVAILCWYNPASWLMRRDLKTLHEFQADDYVLKTGIEPKQYQLFLIARASGSTFPHIANNLDNSQLSNRIIMMNRRGGKDPNPKSRYALPIVGIILAVGLTSVAPVKDVISPATAYHPSASGANLQDINIFVDGEKVSVSDMQNIPKSEIKAITVFRNPKRIEIEMKESYRSTKK